MKRKTAPFDVYIIFGLEPIDTPGNEIAIGSDIIRENFKFHSLSCLVIHGIDLQRSFLLCRDSGFLGTNSNFKDVQRLKQQEEGAGEEKEREEEIRSKK